MILHTASEVISLARSLENESARFYEDLSEEYKKDEETRQLLLSFAKENKNNIKQIEMVYHGVISDAIEGCFAFDMEADKYGLDGVAAGSCDRALGKSVEMEEIIMGFYSDAAEQSNTLMADIPRAFSLVAKKRGARLLKLKSLLESDSSARKGSDA